MSEQAVIADEIRTRILEQPDVILEDPDVMRALITANDRAVGANVVDLRGVAMDRLEARLQRLEETHRSVIAAAYENLAGMTQVHRAILAFLEPLTFEAFLSSLEHEVPEILRIRRVRLVLESHEADDVALANVDGVLTVVRPGFVADYMTQNRNQTRVILRRADGNARLVFGEDASWVQSEACLYLDFGDGRLPGMLAFAADNHAQFTSSQGTDLLDFMSGVFERTMCRWLG
ncbi:MAG: DUF484 family protein [Pseudomonadota bacterium]